MERIVWMIDETIANTKPENWDVVTSLEQELVTLISNPNFHHEVVHPKDCLPKLVGQLKGEKFSCIFDLTGWFNSALRELFPSTSIENRFSLSRVRMVSSPRLETTGYTVSVPPSEIERIKKGLDLSKPLVFDDVSFTGWTSRKTMELWKINPQRTTFAFLIANTGNFGPDKKGAVGTLRSLGSRVFFGHELKTPKEDGWHLKDLHQNRNLEQAFILSLLFQEAVKNGGLESPLAQNFFSHETVIRTLFPEYLTSEQIRELTKSGKFILLNRHCLETEAIHAKNPFLWASPYFQEHVDVGKILVNKNRVVKTLKNLSLLTTEPEGKREASIELGREIQRLIAPFQSEGQIFKKGERML